MRQLIIARKDLQMSPGKLAAQCCHASLAFLTDPIGMKNRMRDFSKADVSRPSFACDTGNATVLFILLDN